ncbi:hypothetical protein [Shewanella sp. UCD-KL12]|uniref:hypothetical protein n=1 Tax=Shewanella sp. UCD-KL12 TaxID=1917163 RepID=UPI000970ABD6|nr:hypothetical protein [Shewanella sp. UCD-KL12]
METTLFLRTIFCCSNRKYKHNTLQLGGNGQTFVIVNGEEFWIVKAENQREALDKLVSQIWNNSHFDYRINGCGWGDFEYIVATLKKPVLSYQEHTGTDTEYLKLLATVKGSESVYIAEEYIDPEDYELYPSMPI